MRCVCVRHPRGVFSARAGGHSWRRVWEGGADRVVAHEAAGAQGSIAGVGDSRHRGARGGGGSRGSRGGSRGGSRAGSRGGGGSRGRRRRGRGRREQGRRRGGRRGWVHRRGAARGWRVTRGGRREVPATARASVVVGGGVVGRGRVDPTATESPRRSPRCGPRRSRRPPRGTRGGTPSRATSSASAPPSASTFGTCANASSCAAEAGPRRSASSR